MEAPRLLSLEFHVRYFPAVLMERLQSEGGAGFAPPFALPAAFVFCLVLTMLGIPGAARGSAFGWITGGLGASGAAALAVESVLSGREQRPSFDGFLVWVFLSFVVLGLSFGIFMGALNHSAAWGLLCGSGGLAGGYVLGIFAGLWLQRLGWLSSLANGLAGVVTLGMLGVDLVLLGGVL